MVLKALDPTQSESPPPSGPVSTASVEEHDSIVTSYKDLIRDLVRLQIFEIELGRETDYQNGLSNVD